MTNQYFFRKKPKRPMPGEVTRDYQRESDLVPWNVLFECDVDED